MSLGAEVNIPLPHFLKKKPTDNIEATETTANMTRSCSGNHVQGVEPTHVRKYGGTILLGNAGREDASEFRIRKVGENPFDGLAG